MDESSSRAVASSSHCEQQWRSPRTHFSLEHQRHEGCHGIVRRWPCWIRPRSLHHEMGIGRPRAGPFSANGKVTKSRLLAIADRLPHLHCRKARVNALCLLGLLFRCDYLQACLGRSSSHSPGLAIHSIVGLQTMSALARLPENRLLQLEVFINGEKTRLIGSFSQLSRRAFGCVPQRARRNWRQSSGLRFRRGVDNSRDDLEGLSIAMTNEPRRSRSLSAIANASPGNTTRVHFQVRRRQPRPITDPFSITRCLPSTATGSTSQGSHLAAPPRS